MINMLRNKQKPLHHPRIVHHAPLLCEVAHSNTVQTLRLLQTTFLGLTEREAASRLEQVGYNEVTGVRSQPWLMQLLTTFVNPFILVLAVLGLVSLVSDVLLASAGARNWTKVLILSVMILVSCLLRFWQEFRSQRAVQRLKALVQTTVTVLRRTDASAEPARRDIPLAEVVPGDLVSLSVGDMIPADLRLLSSRGLFVSQSILTGEAMPVEKCDTETRDKQRDGSDVLEKPQLCFMGSNVVSGTATAIVVTTGSQTFLSAVAASVLKRSSMTSFEQGINQISWVLIRLMGIMAPIR